MTRITKQDIMNKNLLMQSVTLLWKVHIKKATGWLRIYVYVGKILNLAHGNRKVKKCKWKYSGTLIYEHPDLWIIWDTNCNLVDILLWVTSKYSSYEWTPGTPLLFGAVNAQHFVSDIFSLWKHSLCCGSVLSF